MIFYKQTKAYHDNGNNVVWTYLTWPNNASTPGETSVADSFMPSLSWSTGNTLATSTKDLGKILTNKVNTTIAGAWSFSQSISTGGLSATGNISTTGTLSATGALSAASAAFTNGLTMGSSRSTPLVANTNLAVSEDIRVRKSLLLFYTGSTNVWSTMQGADVGSTIPFFQLEANTASTCQFNYHTTGVANNIFVVSESGAKMTINSQFYASNGANITGAVSASGVISSGSYCQASYFNATSDRRAKENIQLASYSALELIKKVQVYNYNYKINSERVTGIMAQDLLEHQPKELDLVSNTSATGENGDYMSIKTDKLVSVLWKAIQEQQEQIEELKKELKTLRGGN